jgi:hypothetical protein
MSDRTNVLAFERRINDGQGSRAEEAWTGRRPAPLQAMAPSRQHAGVAEPVPATTSMPDRTANRKSWFARIVDALHESRRLQAAQIIHDCQHLVQQQSSSERE